jgi:predicted XRE-type DNA-binding protein
MMNNLEKMNFEDSYGFTPVESKQTETILTDEEKHFMGIDTKNAPEVDPDDAEDEYNESFGDYEDEEEEEEEGAPTEPETIVDEIIEQAKLLDVNMQAAGMLETKSSSKSVLLESEIQTFTESEYKRFVDEINKKVWTSEYDSEKQMLIYTKVA